MMNQKVQMLRRKSSNIVSLFLSGVQKSAARRAEGRVDFFTRSAMPALLSLQADVRAEQR